jgi:hypothetical protein
VTGQSMVWHGIGDIRLDTVPDPGIEEPTDAVIRITRTDSVIPGRAAWKPSRYPSQVITGQRPSMARSRPPIPPRPAVPQPHSAPSLTWLTSLTRRTWTPCQNATWSAIWAAAGLGCG